MGFVSQLPPLSSTFLDFYVQFLHIGCHRHPACCWYRFHSHVSHGTIVVISWQRSSYLQHSSRASPSLCFYSKVIQWKSLNRSRSLKGNSFGRDVIALSGNSSLVMRTCSHSLATRLWCIIITSLSSCIRFLSLLHSFVRLAVLSPDAVGGGMWLVLLRAVFPVTPHLLLRFLV